MKRSLKDLLVEQPERGVQYKTLNDAAMAQSGRAKGFEQGMQPGDVKIWYYRSEVGRDVSFGIDFYVNNLGGKVPTSNTIEDTHILLGSIRERDLESIFYFLQGEVWSPKGEAWSLIESLGLTHTSMSVGDIVEMDGNLYFTDRFGFKKLVNGEIVESTKRGAKKIIKEEFDELTGISDEDGLYYDINDLSTTILDWHGGQSSPTYALGSSWYAGHGVTRDVLSDAIGELEFNSTYPDNEEDAYSDELLELIDALNYQLKPY